MYFDAGDKVYTEVQGQTTPVEVVERAIQPALYTGYLDERGYRVRLPDGRIVFRRMSKVFPTPTGF